MNQWVYISVYIHIRMYVCVCVCVCVYNPTDRNYNWKVLLRSLFFDEVLFIVVVPSLSHIRLFVTPWTAACQASLSLTSPRACSNSCPYHSYLWVGDTIQPSHPLLPPSSALNLSQHPGRFWWVGSSYQVAKELELQHQSFQRAVRVDFL